MAPHRQEIIFQRREEGPEAYSMFPGLYGRVSSKLVRIKGQKGSLGGMLRGCQ